MTQSSEKRTLRALTFGYIFALGIVGTVAGTAHLVTSIVIESQSTNASVVNVSGRQRMLSQRIALLATSWKVTKDEGVHAELADTIKLFADSHHGILNGSTILNLPTQIPDSVKNINYSAPFLLDDQVKNYIQLANEIVSKSTPDIVSIEQLVAIASDKKSETSLLVSLDKVVKAFEENHIEQIDWLEHIQKLALYILIFTLILEALIIFRPLVKRIKQLTEDLNQAAFTDALTNINNRRGFVLLGNKFIQQRKEGAILICDIDHFKKINDTYGHAAGDACIQHIANMAQEVFRTGDVYGRIGGEEFAIVLPSVSAIVSEKIAERFRESIADNPCITNISGDDLTIPMTLSIGISYYGDYHEYSLDQLLHDADEALYKAKKLGRNRTELFQKVEIAA